MTEGSTILRIEIHKVAPLILAIFFLTGCCNSTSEHFSDFASNASELLSDVASEVSGAVSDYLGETASNTPQHYAVEIFNKVFELLQAKDCQAIFDMFSEYDKANVDLMPDIEKLVEFMDGEVTEIGHVAASNLYSSIVDGIAIDAAYTADSIIKTDNGVTYWIKVRVITAAEIDTKLGLDSIYILNCDVKSAYSKEWGEWNQRRIDGAKDDEPQKPENFSVKVNY